MIRKHPVNDRKRGTNIITLLFLYKEIIASINISHKF